MSPEEAEFEVRRLDGKDRPTLRIGSATGWLEVLCNPKGYCFVTASRDGQTVYELQGESRELAVAAARAFAANGELILSGEWRVKTVAGPPAT